MKKTEFGQTKSGETVYLYELKNNNGMVATVTDFGANLVSLTAPDKKGVYDDVVLGYDKVSDYEKNGSFFGAVIAPSANRIAGASFEIDGKKYDLQINDGENNLHSDVFAGVHKRIWESIPPTIPISIFSVRLRAKISRITFLRLTLHIILPLLKVPSPQVRSHP